MITTYMKYNTAYGKDLIDRRNACFDNLLLGTLSNRVEDNNNI